MPQVGFESTIIVFEREKTVHDLDRTATVIGCYTPYCYYYYGSAALCSALDAFSFS
jgi:hypothetical protein